MNRRGFLQVLGALTVVPKALPAGTPQRVLTAPGAAADPDVRMALLKVFDVHGNVVERVPVQVRSLGAHNDSLFAGGIGPSVQRESFIIETNFLSTSTYTFDHVGIFFGDESFFGSLRPNLSTRSIAQGSNVQLKISLGGLPPGFLDEFAKLPPAPYVPLPPEPVFLAEAWPSFSSEDSRLFRDEEEEEAEDPEPLAPQITADLPIINPGRCCVECRHFDLDTGQDYYSSETPGSEFAMDCDKRRWEWDTGDSEDHYRECILAAARCSDFEERRKA